MPAQVYRIVLVQLRVIMINLGLLIANPVIINALPVVLLLSSVILALILRQYQDLEFLIVTALQLLFQPILTCLTP